MKNRALVLFVLVFAVLLGSLYAASPQSGSAAKNGPQSRAQATDSHGAELFTVHCGRCHKPPNDLSPRVVPAVMAHMRNRAMLSRQDEQEILKFLAPQ
jgi:mono/diheme cytochrome c family protein